LGNYLAPRRKVHGAQVKFHYNRFVVSPLASSICM
jgi:hypothetical protein